jgi:CheY-like chemotaxis protein
LPLLTIPEVGPAQDRTAIECRKTPSRSIVLIEDGDDAREMLAAFLRLEGHQVSLAGDGHSGLLTARTVRPEVVICDIGLPKMNGFDVVRALRADPKMNGCLYIALTGYGDELDRQRTKDAGFHVHLTKPVNPREITRIIAENWDSRPEDEEAA